MTILIYLLIGWFVGFALTIYYSFEHVRNNLDEEIIPIILLCILYWPWFSVVIIHHFSKPFIKKNIKKLKNIKK